MKGKRPKAPHESAYQDTSASRASLQRGHVARRWLLRACCRVPVVANSATLGGRPEI